MLDSVEMNEAPTGKKRPVLDRNAYQYGPESMTGLGQNMHMAWY